MKIKITSVVLLMMLVTFSVQAQGIRFKKGTWAEVQAMAKAENKYIFVDVFTTWCGPCAYLSERIFTQAKVGNFFNQKFINYQIDAEKGEGVMFARTHGVRAYPTMLYFNPQGEIVHKTVGSGGADKIVDFAHKALNPETQFFTLKKKFKEGNREAPFLKEYSEALAAANESNQHVLELYFKHLDKDKWASKENWELMRANVTSSSSAMFEYLFDNQEKFLPAFKETGSYDPKRDLKIYITVFLKKDIPRVARTRDRSQAEALAVKLKKHFEEREANEYIAKLNYLFYINDTAKAEKYTDDYFDNHCTHIGELKQIAKKYHQKYNDRPHLEKALSWMKKSIEMSSHKGSESFYILAQILYKLQRYPEALGAVNQSIKIIEGFKQDSTEAKKLAEAIRAKI